MKKEGEYLFAKILFIIFLVIYYKGRRKRRRKRRRKEKREIIHFVFITNCTCEFLGISSLCLIY